MVWWWWFGGGAKIRTYTLDKVRAREVVFAAKIGKTAKTAKMPNFVIFEIAK